MDQISKILDTILEDGVLLDPTLVKQSVEEEMYRKNNLFLKIPDGFYDDAKYKVELVITGENVDVGSKIETFKTILQLIASNPTMLVDPAIRAVLNKVVSLTGENLDAIVGKMMAPMAQMTGGGRAPNMSENVPGIKKELPLLTSQPGTEEAKL